MHNYMHFLILYEFLLNWTNSLNLGRMKLISPRDDESINPAFSKAFLYTWILELDNFESIIISLILLETEADNNMFFSFFWSN